MQTFIDRYPKKDEAIKEIVSYILENPSGKVAVQCDSGKLAKQAGRDFIDYAKTLGVQFGLKNGGQILRKGSARIVFTTRSQRQNGRFSNYRQALGWRECHYKE